MKRFFSHVKSRRGLTLIELLLASAITVMVIGAAGTALILGVRMFHSTTQTAQEQREIKLAEATLKDNFQTALAFKGLSAAPESGKLGALKNYFYFNGDSFVMQLGMSKIETGNILSINITLHGEGKVAYAQYLIETSHITYNGVVVMNNMSGEDVPAGGYEIVLAPGSDQVLYLLVPDRDDPFQVEIEP